MAQHQEVRLQQVVEPRLFEIADYQRVYAWEVKHLSDLWEDLDLVGPGGSHYAGTLVIREVSDGARAKECMSDDGSTLTVCEVVDGQQRLTTCLVLIDRIRRRLLELHGEGVPAAGVMAAKARATYGMLKVNGADVPRLRLGAGLNQFWVDTVLGDHVYVGAAKGSGQVRLEDAAVFFDGRLAGLVDGVSPDEAFGRLKDLYSRVTSGLKFLVYEVGSSAEVGVIFETLNERGRPLTDLEKAKNYFLYLARSIPDASGEQLAEQINSAWGEIFSNLAGEPRAMEDQLLRGHWLAVVNPDRKSWSGIASIKKRFDRSRFVPGHTRLVPQYDFADPLADSWQRLRTEVGDYVRQLRDCSYYQAEMFDAGAAFASFPAGERSRARNRSAALRRSGTVAPYRPLLFAVRLRYPENGRLYADLVDLCETFTARVFVIGRLRSNTGESAFYRLAHGLYHGKDADVVLRELAALVWYYVPDRQMRRAFDEPQDWYARRGHKYLLYEYERSKLAPGEELPPLERFLDSSGPQRTTEHILPQTATAPCWTSVFSKEHHARYLHTLGNLALTLDNSRYQNRCFVDKRGAPPLPGEPERACYAQGKLLQERELARYPEWTPETIMQRQRELGEWALGRWHIDPPEPADLQAEAASTEYEDDDLPDTEGPA